MKKHILFFLLLCGAPLHAETPVFSLPLEKAEQETLQSSPRFKAAQADADASRPSHRGHSSGRP
jgi:hypothetical protein